MSSLESTFAIAAFRDALGAAVKQAQTNPDSISKALRSDAKAPRGVNDKTWLNLVGAVRLAYVIAVREDRAEVVGDIRASLAGEFSDAEVDQFLTLLSQDDAVDARSAEVLGLAKDGRTEVSRDPHFRVNGATSPTTSTIWTLGNG